MQSLSIASDCLACNGETSNLVLPDVSTLQAGGVELNYSETARAVELSRYDILDTSAEEAFDRITRLAKLIAGTPISIISLIDSDRQWFKSHDGLDVCETSRDVAFCDRTVSQNLTLVIEDASKDPRYCLNPLVVGPPYIRFYAGVPLRTPRGIAIGSLCVISPEPKQLSAVQMSALEDLSRIVVDELELRRLATDDSLTGCLRRSAFLSAAKREMQRAARTKSSVSIAMLDIDHFKSVNDTYGHGVGDQVLSEVIATAKMALRRFDTIGRIGGEEFAILIPHADGLAAEEAMQRVRRLISETVINSAAAQVHITVSIGVTTVAAGEDDIAAILARADASLYAAKKGGRNRVVSDGHLEQHPIKRDRSGDRLIG